MAATLGKVSTHDDVSAAVVEAAQAMMNDYINNELILGKFQACLGTTDLRAAAGLDTNNPDDMFILDSLLAAMVQRKATFEGTSGVAGAFNIVTFCSKLTGPK
jgi:hypothetical protein